MSRLLLAVFLIASAAFAQKSDIERASNRPIEPFRIMGNLFYVGGADVTSYLIATPKGHIVIDGGFEESAPMIRDNVEKLGFRFSDVRILLSTHAHYDHAGGLARMKEWTNATLMAGERDAPLLARGGKDDPQFGDSLTFPPVTADRLLRDGDRVALGGSILDVHLTPGHTPGCVTYTMTLREKKKAYLVVILGSPTVPQQYKLVGNKRYPDVVADYRHTFTVLKSLPCDVFLGSHGTYFDLLGKAGRVAKREKPNPFIDPDGYLKFVAEVEQAFEEALKKES